MEKKRKKKNSGIAFYLIIGLGHFLQMLGLTVNLFTIQHQQLLRLRVNLEAFFIPRV
jgi:hypothetical protein